MEIIGKISKGSKMDQIYIPKKRVGLAIGNYVIIRPLEEQKPVEKLYFYGVKEIEPLKLAIVQEVVKIIDKSLDDYENVFVTGSFLDKGFHFNDVDILIATKDKINHELIKDNIERKTGIKAHILSLSNKELIRGLETDPLYQMMLSRCVSKKRFIYGNKQNIDYKLLDLHLLKSRALIDNFEMLSGSEKYDLVRNMIAIHLYLEKMSVSNELIYKEIKKSLEVDIQEIKQNMVAKKDFLKKYKLIYDRTFAKILNGIEHGTKQK